MNVWPSSPNRSRWALLASLCLNLVLAGYVTMQWMQPAWSPANGGMPLKIVERLAARLPPEDAGILWRLYRAREPEVQPLQADYARALFKTLRLAGQTDIDKAALRAAILEARDKRIKVGDAMIDTFIDALEQISPKGRRQLVGSIAR